MNKRSWILILVVAAVAIPLASAAVAAAAKNQTSRQLLDTRLHLDTPMPAEGSPAPGAVSSRLPQDCAGAWLAAQNLDPVAQSNAYRNLLACPSQYLAMMSFQRPADQDLAGQAVRQNPSDPAAWFWLANAQEATNSPAALDSYLKVVGLDPTDGLAWCRLGFGYEGLDQVEPARDAFLKCCQNEDPGSNGCFGAGRMEEKLGNPRQAILDYRLSRWDGALKKANALAAEQK